MADYRLATSPFPSMLLRVVSLRDSLCRWWKYLAAAKYLVCWLRWVPRACSPAKIDLFREGRYRLIVSELENTQQFFAYYDASISEERAKWGVSYSPQVGICWERCCPWSLLWKEKSSCRFASLRLSFLSYVTIFFFSLSPLLVLTHVLVYLTIHLTNLRSDGKSE